MKLSYSQNECQPILIFHILRDILNLAKKEINIYYTISEPPLGV